MLLQPPAGQLTQLMRMNEKNDAASRLEFKSYSDCKRVHPSYETLLPVGI